MPYANLQITLTDAERTAILTKIDELKALLPFMVNLTKKEKTKGRRLGAKAQKLFIDVLELITTSPEYKPAYINRDDMAADLDIYIALLAMELKVKMLAEGLADTRLALEQEMIRPSLAIYAGVQQAALANVPGSDSALEKLKIYFKKRKEKRRNNKGGLLSKPA